MKTFTVYYRTGGIENFQWKKALPVMSKEEAVGQVANLKKSGYPAHYEDSAILDSIGLPETYNAESH